MLILLSPAKTMAGTSKIQAPQGTLPRFREEASEIALRMAQLPMDELRRVLRLSPKLAVECYRKFQDFHSEDTPALQALLAYTGVVFKHINPRDFTEEDFRFSQACIRIASGCYGLLRPLDLIKPYRMEYETRLTDLGDMNIYTFWRDRLTDVFLQDIRQDDGILLNLASQDVRPSFHWKELERSVRIITPEFKVWKKGKAETVVIYAKMCRGEMSRYLIKNRIDDPEALKSFRWEGFAFKESMSDTDNWVFLQE